MPLPRRGPTLDLLCRLTVLVLGLVALPAAAQPAAESTGDVRVLRLPEGGMQPRAAEGPDGTVHVVYLSGDPKACDVLYITLAPGATAWSEPVRVNSIGRSALALGATRGAQLALGREGAVFVTWNGSGGAGPESLGFFISRIPPGGSGFEAQRSLMTRTAVLDGGGSVAADPAGNVIAVWHAVPADAEVQSEASRRVFLARSADDGVTFGPEEPVNERGGVCGCCWLEAGWGPSGALHVLYRAVTEGTHRDMHLITLLPDASPVESVLDTWEVASCPMTTGAIEHTADGLLLAWEDQQDVRGARLDAGGVVGETQRVGDRNTQRKHPRLATQPDGRVLVAWAEGMRWGSEGRVRWLVKDGEGAVLHEGESRAKELPAWSFPAVAARPDGGFLVIY